MALIPSDGSKVDWENIEREVILKLRALRACVESVPADSAARMMFMRDLVLPAMKNIAKFCVTVKIQEEDGCPPNAPKP